jgi:UDP-N-acetylmuramate dehydrogenase
MSQHTSWRAGGYAERVYQPADLADLIVFLHTLPAGLPVVAVGLGSNLLVRDGGLRGTVLLLHAALTEMRIEADGSIYVQAGVTGAKLARFAAKHNLRGAEFFAGIPGTLGGMLAMNAGCYGSETWNVVANAQTLMRSGKLLEREPNDYEISYRHVVLRKKDANLEHDDARIPNSLPFHQEEFFVGARLRLPTGDGEVARREIKALLSRRIASQPLNLPNAGSVFRNPPNDYAARLIEQCGLKNLQIGGARVSEQHANFIVNVGGATAADIENLITEVQARVQHKAGICLHQEVRIIGEYANTHE